MSTVIFMCGPSGSGKSTYAKRLEADGMVRLSFDAEMWRRGITELPAPQETLNAIEVELQQRLAELVRQGRDVVLDFPFSTREMRQNYRRLLAPHGVVPETIYLATDRATVLRRLEHRRDSRADDLSLELETATKHYDGFEPPSPDEGPLRVIL